VTAAAKPSYEIRIEDCPQRVRVLFGGVPVADSARAKVLIEGRLPPAYYFPRADVRMDLLRATAHRTYCPFRGNASHFTVTVGNRSAENSAWSYETPYEEAGAIKGYVAFYAERMDAISIEADAHAPPAAIDVDVERPARLVVVDAEIESAHFDGAMPDEEPVAVVASRLEQRRPGDSVHAGFVAEKVEHVEAGGARFDFLKRDHVGVKLRDDARDASGNDMAIAAEAPVYVVRRDANARGHPPGRRS